MEIARSKVRTIGWMIKKRSELRGGDERAIFCLNTVNTWLNELAAEEYDMGILKLGNIYEKCLNAGVPATNENNGSSGAFNGGNLTLAFKQHSPAKRGYFETDLVIVNRWQVTGTSLSWHPLSKLPRHTSRRTFGSMRMILCSTGPSHGGSLLESGLEHGAFDSEADTLTLGHRGLNSV
ncbi:hypothetical protein AVEN_121455-1 [Araneus ventricosus]|uniref:Uncharacterized protein n=1 Tax=Araneus ventricosus TaxID=182803 RepID=A0A4Y2DN17_ARAVE|nr:hypothetical protein AVEN_121455-1 [Araneus ventricosus]